MGLRDTFLNMLGVETPEVQKTSNQLLRSSKDFLKYGNRETLYPSWSDIKMSDSDMYRGYAYAVIQKRGNKVASLARENLKTYAKPEVVDEYQKNNEVVYHPYLKLIEDSTDFTEKQFWKNISIYLDLAGRYYLGVVRNEIKPLRSDLPTITTDIKKFIMLNPYEIRRVINKDGVCAGYIERKKDGRYREWALHQIIEMRELNPFDPENSQWAMTDAAKDAVYTINQSGDYTRQSLGGNIDAPGIITTDLILGDEDFANFRSRVQQHKKGEPLFGNGSGSISWQSMQVDLDKAALLDINEINRTTLFAVSGTSKTALGIEQSGTTRETARVQSEQFVSDTAQPRLEDIVDFLNLDYKRHYNREYQKTGYSIEVESAVGKDYDTETKATQMRQSQFTLANTLMQAGYTKESSYQYAEGEIDLADLELEKGLDKPKNPEEPEEPEEGEGGGENQPKPTPTNPTTENSLPKEQGWVGAKTEPIKVTERLTPGLKTQLFDGELQEETTNIPAEENPHFTVIYGLTAEGASMDMDDMAHNYIPNEVTISNIEVFEPDREYNVVVAKLQETPELTKMREGFMSLEHYDQEFEYNPHITLCYVKKDADKEGFINAFKDLEGKTIKVTGWKFDNPFNPDKSMEEDWAKNSLEEIVCSCGNAKIDTYLNKLGDENSETLKKAYNEFLEEVRAIEKETINYAANKLTVNAFEQDDIITKRKRNALVKKLKEFIKNYWWILMPLFAGNSMASRNKEYGREVEFVFSEALKNGILKNAEKVADGHISTILGDILEASNRAYTAVLEDAASTLIVKAYDVSPGRFDDYFDHTPTKADALEAIQKTDILEKNKKIYEKANQMAYEGYSRGDIIKAVKAEYKDISTKRAGLIADNETARAFSQSQFEADKQFLNSIGKMDNAYKRLVSHRPDKDKICAYCQHLIEESNANPVPFEQPFLAYGDSIEVVENGKVKTFTANYENILGGTVHPNCQCEYELVFKNEQGEFTKTLNKEKTNGHNLSSEDMGVDNNSSNSGNDSDTDIKQTETLNTFEGHLGRPGEVGGSLPRTAKGLINSSVENKLEVFKTLSVEEQAKFLNMAMELPDEDLPSEIATTPFNKMTYALGINGKPTELDNESFDNMIKNGSEPLYRIVGGNEEKGLTSRQVADQLTKGEYTYQGQGSFADGTYFAKTSKDIEKYAQGRADTTKIKATLAPGAKILPAGDTKIADLANAWRKAGAILSKKDCQGLAALYEGYDGRVIPSIFGNKEEYICLYRRDNLIIRKDYND